jgi:hypothetical protein
VYLHKVVFTRRVRQAVQTHTVLTTFARRPHGHCVYVRTRTRRNLPLFAFTSCADAASSGSVVAEVANETVSTLTV